MGLWAYDIDQANTAAESNGRFFNKTNRFESIRTKRIGESIRIANRNALDPTYSATHGMMGVGTREHILSCVK